MKRAYHHGDLRAVLIEEALRLIVEHGPDGFTLREVARVAGVSHAAPYRHFPSKAALLSAIAGQGSQLLRASIEAGLQSAPDMRAKFLAAGLCYVRFALEHPAHFRVMFSGADAYDADPVSRSARAASLETLLAFIREGQRCGLIRKGDPRALATPIWAMHHGLACLASAGQLPVRASALRRAVDASHAALLDGLTPRPDRPPSARGSR